MTSRKFSFTDANDVMRVLHEECGWGGGSDECFEKEIVRFGRIYDPFSSPWDVRLTFESWTVSCDDLLAARGLKPANARLSVLHAEWHKRTGVAP